MSQTKLYKEFKEITTNEVINVKKDLGGGAFLTIPFDPANTHYQEYLKRKDAGNTPEAAD